MIRSLRTRHRTLILAVAITAAILIAAGLAARRPIPTQERLPSAITEAAP